MEHPSAPPPELAEFLMAEAPAQDHDMLSFLAALGDDENENLGDAVDLDEVLARELQRQEEELEAERLRMEAADRELARVESERDMLFGLSSSQEARDQAFAAALAQEERDQEIAARLARDEQASLTRSAEARAAADYAFALSLQEAESAGPRPSEVSASDRALAMALVEADREEEEARNRHALQAQQRAKDEAFAKKLLKQEQDELAREELERTRASQEADVKLTPAPQVDLTRSKEGLLEESEHAEFLVGCELSYLRAYLAAHRGCVVRPVVNAALRAKFVARRERMAAMGRSKIHLAFHGTKVRHLPSIESGGLKVPGNNGNGVNHESDSGWWGKGIYSSYDPGYAAGYAEAGKLIVIAVLLGRPYRITERRDGGSCEPGFDSHIAEDGREYVCFHDDQVLPLFVIDTHAKPPSLVKPPPKKPWNFPGGGGALNQKKPPSKKWK